MLYKQLNGIPTGEQGQDTEGYPSNIFLTNTSYVPSETLGSKPWNTMIETINWKYGDIDTSSTGADQAGTGVLTKEKSWTDTVSAKIGLMYLSDYYLAYNNTTNWYSKTDTSNWIHLSNNDTDSPYGFEWTMSRTNSDDAWDVRGFGDVADLWSFLIYARSVRPVFYLSEKIQLKEGTIGTIDNPYIIAGVSE